ncbi:MAG: hypothetical protein JNN28_14970 [Saprospiraceae bacterium]|nr:hypothetical protein [Saprospiraceae bacterium]
MGRKAVTPIVFCLFLVVLPFHGITQCTPEQYQKLLQEADGAAKLGEYNLAIAKLQSAKVCQPGRETEVNKRIVTVFEKVNGERKEAVRQRERAEEQSKIAQLEKEKAEMEARRIYANDLAFKSQIALRDGDRDVAFRLAEFAYRYVDADNPKVLLAMIEALYYDDFQPVRSPMPRHCFEESSHNRNQYPIRSYAIEPEKEIDTLPAYDDTIRNKTVSPDGRLFATWADTYDFNGDRIDIWDLGTKTKLFTLAGHNYYINCGAFSPNGKWLATGSEDRTVIIWDIETQRALFTLTGADDYITSVAFSSNGKWLATGYGHSSVKIWSIETQTALFTLNVSDSDKQLTYIAFSSDSKKLMTGVEDEPVKVWILDGDELIARWHRRDCTFYLTYEQLEEYGLSKLLDVSPKNECLLCQSNDPHQIEAFAELYTIKAAKSQILENIAADYARASRLLKCVIKGKSDSLPSIRLGTLYFNWAIDILASNRPDTAWEYIELACQQLPNLNECLRLHAVYSYKTNDYHWFLAIDNHTKLMKYASYFLVDIRSAYSSNNKVGKLEDLIQWHGARYAKTLSPLQDIISSYQAALCLLEKQLAVDTTVATQLMVANEFSNMALYQLFMANSIAAEICIHRSLQIDSTNKYAFKNLPPAFLLQGRWPEAEAEYHKWKDVKYGENNLPTYRDAFLSDLNELERQGVTHPDFARARALLQQK